MKFDDLRPCDGCGEGLGLTFHRVTDEHHIVDPTAARQRMGLDMMFAGTRLGGVFDPSGDQGTKIASSETVLLCESCWAMGHAPMAVEKRCAKKEGGA